jgi:hypothetical protein
LSTQWHDVMRTRRRTSEIGPVPQLSFMKPVSRKLRSP